MDKKLPSIYANKIDKELNNNERVYYSESKRNIDNERNDSLSNNKDTTRGLNINQKINNIFNSNKYVYKADVVITTKDGKIVKKIIGQNSTHLITIENELIPISNIIDINFTN